MVFFLFFVFLILFAFVLLDYILFQWTIASPWQLWENFVKYSLYRKFAGTFHIYLGNAVFVHIYVSNFEV